MTRLALYQPDIPGNTGALVRLGACLGVPVEIIEPCGFVFSDARLRRSAMDYALKVVLRRHADWSAFDAWRRNAGHRLILVETGSRQTHTGFAFGPDDILMLGRETAGTPAEVAAACDATISIPMIAGVRSLNVAVAAAIVLGEALRQTDGFPKHDQNTVD
jgi:tRNA (cytidine/uridine-2'-O-)-methyltransferase